MNDPITNPLPEATTSTNWTYGVSLDNTIDLQPTSLTLTDGARCVMTITKEGRLVPGEGLSPDEATQGMFKTLTQLWEQNNAYMGDLKHDKERLDWLEQGVTPRHDVFIDRDEGSFAIRIWPQQGPGPEWTAPTLRAAIDSARAAGGGNL